MRSCTSGTCSGEKNAATKSSRRSEHASTSFRKSGRRGSASPLSQRATLKRLCPLACAKATIGVFWRSCSSNSATPDGLLRSHSSSHGSEPRKRRNAAGRSQPSFFIIRSAVQAVGQQRPDSQR